VRIIEASPADAAALQSLHITTWMATYKGLVPESFYRERSTAHGGRDWADLVRRQRAGGGGVLIAIATAASTGFVSTDRRKTTTMTP
jgi:hypothetical protein